MYEDVRDRVGTANDSTPLLEMSFFWTEKTFLFHDWLALKIRAITMIIGMTVRSETITGQQQPNIAL